MRIRPEEIKAQIKRWVVDRGRAAVPTIQANHDPLRHLHELHGPVSPILAHFRYSHGSILNTSKPNCCALVDEMPAAKLTLTPYDKRERLEQLKVQLADAQRLECALIAEALDKGMSSTIGSIGTYGR